MRTGLFALAAVFLTALGARGEGDGWPPENDPASARAVRDRFAAASPDTLGTTEDALAIKEVVLAALSGPGIPAITKIRWVSRDLAMVEGLRAEAGGWIFVLEREQNKWVVVRRYLTRIF